MPALNPAAAALVAGEEDTVGVARLVGSSRSVVVGLEEGDVAVVGDLAFEGDVAFEENIQIEASWGEEVEIAVCEVVVVASGLSGRN